MRFPSMRDLTEAQKNVYFYAPTDKHVLVNGPPGTGKTLIACLRAIELQKRKVPVKLGMFNRVLTRYSSDAGEHGAMPSTTAREWFQQWWHQSGLPPHPHTADPIALEVPYAEREEARRLGARWDSRRWGGWSRRPGAWVIEWAPWHANQNAFRRWKAWHEPPIADPAKKLKTDWKAVWDHIMMHEAEIPDAALDLGVLLLDEGQDFAKDFYHTLGLISAIGGSRGKRVKHPLRCFVLADENQQITDENSTLEQIATGLKIPNELRYTLLDNFRNTREVAELARQFFADVGAIPNLPVRRGPFPQYFKLASLDASIQVIKNWVVNNPGKEAGVLVFTESKRAAACQRLETALSRVRNGKVTLQTYSWESRRENPAKELLFDHPDTVTVLNMQSAKGLEFDAVFILDLHEAQIGIYGEDRFKMQMFVAASRAREFVCLADSGPAGGSGRHLAFLPGTEYLERVTSGQIAGMQVETRSQPMSPASGADAPSTAAPLWLSAALEYAERKRLTVDDRRSRGGAMWIDGGPVHSAVLRPLGFIHSPRKNAWWRS